MYKTSHRKIIAPRRMNYNINPGMLRKACSFCCNMTSVVLLLNDMTITGADTGFQARGRGRT